MTEQNIKYILLDIGDVLLNVDWDQFSMRLGLPDSAAISAVRNNQIFDSHERGHVLPEDFFNYIKKEFQLPHSIQDIEIAWNSIIIDEIAGVAELIQQYKNKNIIFYALTNTSPTHLETIHKDYPLFKSFKKVLSSCELHSRKPDQGIYLAALKEMQCRPEQVLFVDDLVENVAGAKSVGIHAEVCKRSAEKLAAIFAKYVAGGSR